MKTSGLALLVAFAATPAMAEITFVSVAPDLGNVSSPTAPFANADSNAEDSLWRQRDGFGETGVTILEAWNGPEDVPVITMTLTGLAAGETYDIYVNYIRFGYDSNLDPTGSDPRGSIRGSLDGANFTLFDIEGGTPGTVGHAELTGFFNPADRVGLRGYLGTAVANGSGEILVYVDDDGSNGSIDERVWFDGASYELNEGAPPDETPPSLLETDPADGAVDVLASRHLVATFDEVIALGATGTITLRNLSESVDTVISLPGPDPDGTLSVSGTELTITPATAFAAGDEYSIEISPTVIEDLSGNAYAGLLDSDDPNWSFTIDGAAPTAGAMGPTADAADVPISSNLTLGFDEDVRVGTGSITIHRASDDSVAATIDVTSGNVSVNGGEVTIDPVDDLAYATTYYVNIPAGAFIDLSGNPFAGIDGTTSWQFTTAALDPGLLFADSFNRIDDTDLNASGSGKSGSLGALDWVEVVNGGDPRISDNTLRLGESGGGGGGWSIAYPDHNFIDPGITAGGEFTVSVDLGSGLGSAGGTRFTGFAIGHSAAELSGWSVNTPAGFPSDFFFGYDITGTTEVKIFAGGSEVHQQGISLAGGTTLSVRFSGISDFNAGSSVSYEAFIDEVSIKTGSFQWSGTDENYLTLYSNYTLDRGLIDRFEVRAAAVAEPLALGISQSDGDLDFEWNSLPGMQYDLVSATDLQTSPSLWAPYDDGVTTYENILGSGTGTNTLSGVIKVGPRRFFALVEEPIQPLLEADFESGNGGFTVVDKSAGGAGTVWAWGAPMSTDDDGAPNPGGSVTTGNDDSAQCWGTDIGNPGFYVDPTDTCLRSPVIDLTGLGGAQLTFAQALDLAGSDSVTVSIIDDATDTPIVTDLIPIADGNTSVADWETVGPIAIPAAALGQAIRIEWRLTGSGGGTADYMGWYLDDVTVTPTGP